MARCIPVSGETLERAERLAGLLGLPGPGAVVDALVGDAWESLSRALQGVGRGGGVYLVGAGPGAWDLATVRGLLLVRAADALVYDRLVDPALVSRARPGAGLYYVGKAPGAHAASQGEINDLLAELASGGGLVVRLHGGDPLTYGRGEEECAHLAARGVRCGVVPGVPSFTAAAAVAMAPLAGRGFSSVFAVATATRAGGSPTDPGRLEALARAADSVAVLMGARRLAGVGRALARVDPEMPVVVVERAYMEGERVVDATAGELAGGAVEARGPAVVIAGGAARWRREVWGRAAGVGCSC